MFFQPTDKQEIEKYISFLKTDSSPGFDGCTVTLIKAVKNELLGPLTHIFNLSLSQGIFPSVWKLATIIPIYKGEDKSIPSNYRPISLLSILSKLLEKVVNKRLIFYLEQHKIISDNQFGFRQGFSTDDAVNLLTNNIAESLDKGLCCLGVFMDLAKAFDTVSIPILLRKLECIGIRGTALDWFSSYLNKRYQRVKIGSAMSQVLPICYGVPQGSILGPTLFSIYMNDILRLQIPGANVVCYADDTVAIFSGPSWEIVRDISERGVRQLNEWLNINLLTLNANKTKFVTFHKTRVSNPHSLQNLKIHTCGANANSLHLQLCACNTIDRVDCIKYLGILIDENVRFKKHILSLVGRTRKIIYIMKTLRRLVNKDILLLVYTALCQSILYYGISVWGGSYKTNMMVLERAQRAVLKVMLSKPFRFSTDDLYNESKVLRVRQLYIWKTAVYMHKKILNSPLYPDLLQKRVYSVPVPAVRTSFARRLPLYQHPNIYNKICRDCNIKTMTSNNAKLKIKIWLRGLGYDETEKIITNSHK
ncbi:hypothetical protein O3G_MSEX013626 [Manduca sexta]|uniref:Reverse transcriptase domain-containing protein n=1 Tax=Manduca sexta TaxID=7130 RepID=A0A922CZJ1_MANSE|nr:hypothetical protein O3G_MSEX013626 [Manduca sexta]